MSQIIRVEKLANQEVPFDEIAEYFGLKNIVRGWGAGDDLPEDSLIIVNSTYPGDDALLLKTVELLVLREKVLPDLKRDIERLLLSEPLFCKRDFSINSVLLSLGIENCSGNIRHLVHEVLLGFGCELVPRSYDLNRKWYRFSVPDVQGQ